MGRITLKGNKIHLRALEPSDLDFLYQVENDEALWKVGNTLTPFSKHLLKDYIENSHLDIFQIRQLRMVVAENNSGQAVGFIDLFDFDPKNKKAGIGIVIYPKEEQGKGFASEALDLICDYGFVHLDLHQIYAGITEDNEKSIRLFKNAGFIQNGRKRDWVYVEGNFKDELFFQKLRS